MKLFLTTFLLILAVTTRSQIPQYNYDEPYQFPSVLLNSGAKDYDYTGQQLAFTGEYRKAIEIARTGRMANRPALVKRFQDILSPLSFVSARDYILKHAANQQIVIINEAHHRPEHRAFSESLLAGLYSLGFRYLGLETLVNDNDHVGGRDSLINTRRYPLVSSGAYIGEPVFGNMVRTALQTGFTVFGYEAGVRKNLTPREMEEARNIADFLKTHPGAKIFIHCGYGHGAECENDGLKSLTMAGFVKEYTGIDPYTIDQTQLTEDEENEFGLNIPATAGPVVFMNTAEHALSSDDLSSPTAKRGCFDLMVAHPMAPYEDGRPRWKKLPGYFAFQPALSAIKLQYPLMLKAYKEGEDTIRAVPADIIIVNNAADKKSLILQKGNYLLKIISSSGEQTGFNFSVK